jgi:transcriptional regulator with XRE-family HTH domain
MHGLLGQIVPKHKATVSHDMKIAVGHSVLMSEDAESIAESEWREGFRQRVRVAQGTRTQEVMSKLLGISRDSYSKIVGARGSKLPIRVLPKFCEICDVSLEWLIEGPKEKHTKLPAKTKAKANATRTASSGKG